MPITCHPVGARSITRAAMLLTLCLALLGCASDEMNTPAKASAGPDAGWGEMSVLIGEGIELGTTKVSVDGKVLGYLDRSCGLIAAAPSGAHEVVVEWDAARISEILVVPKGGMISVKISPDLTFVTTDPVKHAPNSCNI